MHHSALLEGLPTRRARTVVVVIRLHARPPVLSPDACKRQAPRSRSGSAADAGHDVCQGDIVEGRLVTGGWHKKTRHCPIDREGSSLTHWRQRSGEAPATFCTHTTCSGAYPETELLEMCLVLTDDTRLARPEGLEEVGGDKALLQLLRQSPPMDL